MGAASTIDEYHSKFLLGGSHHRIIQVQAIHVYVTESHVSADLDVSYIESRHGGLILHQEPCQL